MVWIKKANGVRERDREVSNQEGVSHMRGLVQGMGIRMAIETHPGGRLSTHASRRHILGFREGYARRCDYDYRPRLGLNMGEGGMDDEQRTYNMNMKKMDQAPNRKKRWGNARKETGPRCATLHRRSENNMHRPKKKQTG